MAQIYGLHIPIRDLDDAQLSRLSNLPGTHPAGLHDELCKGFNPDEPRVPAGDPRGGQWTSEAGDDGDPGGDSASSAADGDDGDAGAASASDTGTDSGAGAAVAEPEGSTRTPDDRQAGERPSMEFRFAPDPTDTGTGGAAPPRGASPSGAAAPAAALATGMGVAAAAAESGSLLGDLPALTQAGLAEMAAGLTGAAIVLGILFIPSNGGMIAVRRVAGAPFLSYRYDRDTGLLQVWQDNGTGGRVLLSDSRLGLDGRFRSGDGGATGRLLPGGGVIVDPDTLPGYRAQPGAVPAAQSGAQVTAQTATQNQTKLCPPPSPDKKSAARGEPYQRYIGTVINGFPLPPGLAVALYNPVSKKDVFFDDCRLSDGTMIEAKGPGYLDMLYKGIKKYPWKGVQEEMLYQAYRQQEAAQGRRIEWHFAEQEVADYARTLFSKAKLRIDVVHTPWRK